MNHQLVHARGEATPSLLPPEMAPGERNVYRDEATAANGPLAESASKPFSSVEEPLGGIELAASSGTDPAERKLLAAISAGDRSALRRLYYLYFRRLAKFFGHLMATSDADVVEELITETMFRIWRARATLATQMPVRVWIMRIAYMCASERLAHDDHLNRSSSKLRFCSPNGDHGASGRLGSPPRGLHDVLGTLPATERAVVHLVYSGHSRQEVADILSMPPEAVDVHLASSMVTLHPWLAARNVTVS